LLHSAVYLSALALLLTGWWLLTGGEGSPSPLARILGAPDTQVHVWFGRGLAVVLMLPLLFWWRSVITFVRETVRIDRGDGRWWRRWPTAIFTGRFARHEGHFDPGQRVANILIVGGLFVLVSSGLGMTMLHGGPLFAFLGHVHRFSTFVVTPILAGHVLVAIGILPGYRGVWRAMHLGGRVSEPTARRLWPRWVERAEASAPTVTDPPARESQSGIHQRTPSIERNPLTRPPGSSR
jgi:cytochrome b subunit of formate dehydrogenase